MEKSPGMAPITTFHKAFALFRFSVIWVGIADRVRAGTAAGADATAHAGMGAKLAKRGMEVVEGKH